MANLTNSAKLIEEIKKKANTTDLWAAALSNQYSDLDWTPTLPTVNDSTITIQKNGANVDSFTTNASSAKSINIQLAKADVWLGNVDNTSDANKPISNATQTALNAKANAADVYTKAEVDSAISSSISSAYKYKGSVANQAALPSTGNTEGDVWNTEDTGMNYAWTGTAWDALWTTVDMSNYLAKNNTTAFTPTWDYQPATKKYVDDNAGKEYNAGEGISIRDISINWRKWPSPDGFHVPSIAEWNWVKNIMDSLSLTTGDAYKINLHIPFAGFRDYDASTGVYRGESANMWSSSTNSNFANIFSVDSSGASTAGIYRTFAQYIRCFKDSYATPDSTWTVVQWTLGNAWIFWNQSEWLISITNWTTGYTIMDKNLWATTVYNNWDTLTQANMGNTYQWWNNYWFPSNWTVTTSSTKVDASNYWPANPYSSSTFITVFWDRSSVQNDDLRWNTTGTISQENVISNTWVLSVNWQTWNVTVQSWSEASWISTSQPSNPVAGSTYYDTTNKVIKVYNWTSWEEVGWGNVIAMTQAQYDALTPAEQADGKLRIITDAPSVEVWSPIVYCTQAEYDALPSSKTSDWKNYVIYE